MSSNHTIQTKIITPTGVVYSGDAVRNINITTEAGEITILPDHTPLISKIIEGTAKVRTDDGELLFTTSAGVLEVRAESEVIILVSHAQQA